MTHFTLDDVKYVSENAQYISQHLDEMALAQVLRLPL